MDEKKEKKICQLGARNRQNASDRVVRQIQEDTVQITNQPSVIKHVEIEFQ